MKTPFFGGCACGAIRYECTAEPIDMFQCHCRDCQRASGGACSYVVVMPANSFKLTQGSPRYHFTPSAAGFQHKRGFCAECGSRISGGENPEGTSPIVGINAASLDDPSWFRPQYDIFISDTQPWDYIDPALPKFKEYGPSDQWTLARGTSDGRRRFCLRSQSEFPDQKIKQKSPETVSSFVVLVKVTKICAEESYVPSLYDNRDIDYRRRDFNRRADRIRRQTFL